jgi:hypothetical protein
MTNILVVLVVAFILWELLEEPAAAGPCTPGVTPGCFGPPQPLSYTTSAALGAADRGANTSFQFLSDEAAALGGP